MTPYEKLNELLDRDITRYTDTVVICSDGEERADVLRILDNMGFSLDTYSRNAISSPSNRDYPYPYIMINCSAACCRPGHSSVKRGIQYEEFMQAVAPGKDAWKHRMTDEEFSAALDAFLA